MNRHCGASGWMTLLLVGAGLLVGHFSGCAVGDGGGGGGGGGGNFNRNTNSNTNSNGNANSNANENVNNNDGGGDSLDVQLSVSNQTPGLFEQVLFTCSLTGQPPEGDVLFNFFPDEEGRLDANGFSGTAVFIVQEEDLGRTFSYQCEATTDTDAGPASNTVTISPTLAP